jgi:hypothetical protein
LPIQQGVGGPLNLDKTWANKAMVVQFGPAPTTFAFYYYYYIFLLNFQTYYLFFVFIGPFLT